MTISPNERTNASENIVSLSIDGNQLNTQGLKIFEVNIDNHPRSHEHITTLCRKSSQKVGVLLRLGQFIPTPA